MILLSPSVRGFEADLCLLILLSSSARGLKLIFNLLTLLSSSTRGLKLVFKWWFVHLTRGFPNLVLFRSCTWKPVKLGSVPILHLKANQTWFCSGLYTWKSVKLVIQIVICILTWTYPWLPVLLHIFDYLDLPLTASLVALLTLSCISTWLDLHL